MARASGSCSVSTPGQGITLPRHEFHHIVQHVVELWHEHIGNPTIADAVLDRLVHGAHRLELKGKHAKAESRQNQA
ncbi:ATP-binding protein [Pseudoroseomonas wenyumeiae]